MKNKRSKAEYISLFQFFKMIPDEETAIEFYQQQRWPNGVICPRCDKEDRIKKVQNKKPQPFHCGHCRKYFSVKVGTVMESSKISLQKWLVVTYIMTASRKGVSSCQIEREIGITQKTAWFLMQRIRESWHKDDMMFGGEIEIDEAYFGGKEKNKHALYYLPVLTAFEDELKRLCEDFSRQFIKPFFQYLIGTQDYYKVVCQKDKVYIQSINMNNTLKWGGKWTIPQKIEQIRRKEGSRSTLLVSFTGGWQLSFRIHNARSRVEPSLKFDIQFVGMPQNVTRHEIPLSN